MPTLSGVREAYSRGGLRAVLSGAARWSRRGLSQALPDGRPTRPPGASGEQHPAKLSALTVRHEDALGWFEHRRKTYERLVDAVGEYVPADGVVFDVGANIGFFTQVLVERTGFRGRVHLFEPVPNLADLCEQSASSLTCTATVHRLGLSDETGTVTIFIGSDGNLGWNTLVAERASQRAMTPVDITVSRFDELGIADRPDFVKIDVEGAEYRVLEGMLPAIGAWTTRPVILCEIGWGTSHPAWDAELAAFDRLVALGYTATHVDGRPVDLRALDRTTDIIFVPAAKA